MTPVVSFRMRFGMSPPAALRTGNLLRVSKTSWAEITEISKGDVGVEGGAE